MPPNRPSERGNPRCRGRTHGFRFAEKVIDVIGLYMNPPDSIVVLSVDEKTQIQALDRTLPMLSLKLGQIER